MDGGLTVDTLLEALRYFFQQIVDHPDQRVDQEKGLTLWGTPADDTLRLLMELFGGKIQITIREAPYGIIDDALTRDSLTAQGANLWKPNEGVSQEHKFPHLDIEKPLIVKAGDTEN